VPAKDAEETIILDSSRKHSRVASSGSSSGSRRPGKAAPPPDKIGKYLIERTLGKGGMGTVYLGREPILDRYVAIKTLLPFTPDSGKEERRQLLERFLREAKCIARLNHKNIVSIYGIGKFGKSLYLVMEYVDGPSIADIIRSREEMPFRDKVRHMIQMCEGLGTIHKAGLVHRDIKPGNIMLTTEGVIKIMDFGAVHTMDSNLTRTEQILGTPSYMSPEQVRGVTPDSRSDIFSLGAVFYQLLTNEKPFTGDTFSTVAYRITHETPPPASRINPLLPKEVDHILGKCLAKSPEDRYASTDELAADLRGLLIRPQRSRKQERSTTLALVAWGFLCLLLLLAAAAAVSWRLNMPEALWVKVGEMVAGERAQATAPTDPAGQDSIKARISEPLSFLFNVAYKPKAGGEVRRLRNGEILSTGDTFRVFFTPQQQCHAYVYMVINGLDVVQLFPENDLVGAALSSATGANPVVKDLDYVLPTVGEPFTLEEPMGSRELFFIASKDRNLEIEKFYKILKNARITGDERVMKIYSFKARMHLKKAPVRTVDDDRVISIPWADNAETVALRAQKMDDLCLECAHSIDFSVR
jgi:hypothetical protein